jgi:hypothetical protein
MNTPPWAQGVNFQMPPGGQLSRAVDNRKPPTSESLHRRVDLVIELGRPNNGLHGLFEVFL